MDGGEEGLRGKSMEMKREGKGMWRRRKAGRREEEEEEDEEGGGGGKRSEGSG